MGNQVCCEANIDDPISVIEMIKQSEYSPGKWPEQDTTIKDWLNAHDNSERQEQEVRKHIYRNQYFLGNWTSGKPTGGGLLYVPKDVIYDGQFVNGVPNGKAEMKFLKNNASYQGMMKQGSAEGQGTYQNQLYKFSGSWSNSKPSSGKIYLFSDPNMIEIQIQSFQDKRATIVYKDMRQYDGEIMVEKLLPHGKGQVKFPYKSSRISYEGQWKEGKMHGYGVHRWKDGSLYKGNYIEGKKEGHGVFIFASGKKYDGQWKEGAQQGLGKVQNSEGDILQKGLWSKGKFDQQISNEDYIKRISQIRGFKEQQKKNQQEIEEQDKKDNNIKKEESEHVSEQKKQGTEKVNFVQVIGGGTLIQQGEKNVQDRELNSEPAIRRSSKEFQIKKSDSFIYEEEQKKENEKEPQKQHAQQQKIGESKQEQKEEEQNRVQENKEDEKKEQEYEPINLESNNQQKKNQEKLEKKQEENEQEIQKNDSKAQKQPQQINKQVPLQSRW